MKSGDLQRAFGVGATTIKNWTEEFSAYLSSTAQGIENRHRRFDSDDFIVMATISELSQRQKLPYSMIHEKLKAGYRVSDVSAATVGYEDGRLVPAAAVEQIIDSAEIRVELEQVKAERDRLLLELDRERQRVAERDNRILEQQSKIEELLRALGRAEGRLEEIEFTRKTKRTGDED